jgi:hypothetical protein
MHIHVEHSNQAQQPSIATAEIHITTLRLYFQLFTTHHATISRFKVQPFLKFVIAINVSAYFAVILCVEIQGNCRAFHAEGK